MKITTERRALLDSIYVLYSEGSIQYYEFVKRITAMKKMSEALVSCKFKELTNITGSKVLPKAVFITDKEILKEFDSLGESKDDYTPVHTTTVKHEMKKEYSYNAKIKAIAGKLNSSKNPELKQISDTLGSLWGWSSKNVDLIFDNLDSFK